MAKWKFIVINAYFYEPQMFLKEQEVGFLKFG